MSEHDSSGSEDNSDSGRRKVLSKLSSSMRRLQNVDKVVLNCEEIELLESTPFAEFFKLKEMKLLPTLISSLIKVWSGVDKGFTLGDDVLVPFTLKDVKKISGLPCGGKKLFANRGAGRGWADKYFGSTLIQDKDILGKLKELMASGSRVECQEDIVRLYILYMFATILFANANNRLESRWCHTVEKLNKLEEYDWADAVYKHLLLSIESVSNKYRSYSNTGKKGTFHVNGAAFILQVCVSSLIIISHFYSLQILFLNYLIST